MRRAGLAASMLFLSLFAAAPTGAKEPDFPVGQHFPTLFIPTLADGKLRGVSSYRGKKLVLHIFASW